MNYTLQLDNEKYPVVDCIQFKSIISGFHRHSIGLVKTPRRTFQRRRRRRRRLGAETCGAELSNATDEKDMFILFFTLIRKIINLVLLNHML